MTIQELQIRIDKKKKDIEKCQKRIDKWTAKKDSEKEFEKEFGWLSTFNDRKEEFKTQWIKECDSELRQAQRDLASMEETLQKYQEQLTNINNFQTSEKIKVIWEFLQNWRQAAYEFYVDNVKLYSKLINEYTESFDAWKDTESGRYYIELATFPNGRVKSSIIKRAFDERYFAPIHAFTKEITLNAKACRWDDAKLNKYLDKDVQNKYEDFVRRISAKAGNILDVNGLTMAANGIINGYVVGDKAKVHVETILAGGYNQNIIVNVKHGQILHYRVLVNVVK